MKKILIGILLFTSVVCFGQNRYPFSNSAHLGGTRTYLTVLNDGNTVAWFKDASDDCTTDGQDSVTVWTDNLNSETLEATDDTGQPPYLDGDTVKFDGATNFLTGTFTYEQTCNVYVVLRQDSWTNQDVFFGDNGTGTSVAEQITSSPQIQARGSTTNTSASSALALDTWGLVQLVQASGNDTLWINDETPLVANIADYDFGGLTVGSLDGGTNPSNISVVEIICRDISDTSADRTLIWEYLESKYGL